MNIPIEFLFWDCPICKEKRSINLNKCCGVVLCLEGAVMDENDINIYIYHLQRVSLGYDDKNNNDDDD